MSTLEAARGTRELTQSQAVNEALAEELRRDPTVYIIGEDVAEAGAPFKVLSGLVDEFGPERVIDSPISEAGIPGPRRRDDGDAACRRHHVRRLPHARHGPARESGGEGAVHVGWPFQGAAHDQ